jgi:hypothetical protein
MATSEMIPIGGKDFPIVLDKDGTEHVKLRELCEPFGLSDKSQRDRLKHHAWARGVMIGTRRSDGKRATFLCLPLRRVPMFFATLDASRVNATFRPALVRMQDVVADAIDDYYRNGGAVRAEALPEQLRALKLKIDEILRVEPATDFVWPAAFCKRYEAWHGRRWSAGDPQPFSMRSANRFFYEMIFPPEILAIVRERGLDEGCRYHQTLNDAPRDYLRRNLDVATKLAEECGSESEWRARMRRWHGKTKASLRGQGELGL